MTSFESRFEQGLAEVPDDKRNPDQFVPGDGSQNADIMIIGEAPGEQEVAQGKPFVGPAGRELTRVLEDLDIERESVYITNVVKTRPPENRSPHVAEIEAWYPVLAAEITQIDPSVIVTLGNTATRAVLDTQEGITEIHGERFESEGRTVFPTFHPAALFYDRSKRGMFEQDLNRAFEDID